MGKIKQALICWNEDNGYDATQTSGWNINKKYDPSIKDLFKASRSNRKLIKRIIKGEIR